MRDVLQKSISAGSTDPARACQPGESPGLKTGQYFFKAEYGAVLPVVEYGLVMAWVLEL